MSRMKDIEVTNDDSFCFLAHFFDTKLHGLVSKQLLCQAISKVILLASNGERAKR